MDSDFEVGTAIAAMFTRSGRPEAAERLTTAIVDPLSAELMNPIFYGYSEPWSAARSPRR